MFMPDQYGRMHNPKIFETIRQLAKHKILWKHDTFCMGDVILEDLVLQGYIDELFTLSDFHSIYISNSEHGKKRNFEVLKRKIFQTRNGIVNYNPDVDIAKKDKNLFVFNASVTKGMYPLVKEIWHMIKNVIPEAKLKVIGGYYKFNDNDAPDDQELMWRKLVEETTNLDVEFTGIISQKEVADIFTQASMFLYPGTFPETFGISTLESLNYNTPLVTTRFGALEETAMENISYFIDYAIEPN
jgi:glycosyltransferase involved in cell wall biosynthesis